MEDIFKVIGIAIIGAIMVSFLRQQKSEFAVMALLASGIIILIIILHSLQSVVLAFNSIVEKTGINNKLFEGLLKIVGVGYVTEYSASVCNDYECGSLAKKVQLCGKIAIFLM
ncbi:MAG: SpoIIIAC/SpoIIIAD family protein, partial [Clostridia bacterium]